MSHILSILAIMHLAHLDTSSRSIESEDELSGKGTRKIIYQHGQFWCVCFLVSCSFFMMYHTTQQTILHEAFWLCVFLWHELVLLCRRRSSMAFFDTEPWHRFGLPTLGLSRHFDKLCMHWLCIHTCMTLWLYVKNMCYAMLFLQLFWYLYKYIYILDIG